MQIIFCDLNRSLVEKVKTLGIEAKWGDYFVEAMRHEKPVLMTASNPIFTFGGGIDAVFYENYRNRCDDKRERGGGNERIENICFVISVDENLRASEEKVREAIEFAIDNTKDDEMLLLHGIGTQIGGLDKDVWLTMLKEILTNKKLI